MASIALTEQRLALKRKKNQKTTTTKKDLSSGENFCWCIPSHFTDWEI
jgi:hypothetical protein